MTLHSIDTRYKTEGTFASREKESTPPIPFFPLLEEGLEKEKRSPFDLLIEESPEEEGQEPSAVAAPFVPVTHSLSSAISAVAPVAPVVDLTALFETMASSMLILDHSGETHTILTLDRPQFADSPLFGTQIIIKEFQTAPKQFNVEILTTPAGLLTLRHAREQLLARFEAGNFNFQIHRLDTHIHTELPSLNVDPDQEKESDQDGHPQEDT